MRFAFTLVWKARWPVALLCEVLCVSGVDSTLGELVLPPRAPSRTPSSVRENSRGEMDARSRCPRGVRCTGRTPQRRGGSATTQTLAVAFSPQAASSVRENSRGEMDARSRCPRGVRCTGRTPQRRGGSATTQTLAVAFSPQAARWWRRSRRHSRQAAAATAALACTESSVRTGGGYARSGQGDSGAGRRCQRAGCRAGRVRRGRHRSTWGLRGSGGKDLARQVTTSRLCGKGVVWGAHGAKVSCRGGKAIVHSGV